MEYRGYSIYSGSVEPKAIEEDGERIMQFLLGNKLAVEQIIIFGRSIGCAVALSIIAKYKIFCIVLLSPFLSLKKITNDLYGSCASALIKETFNN